MNKEKLLALIAFPLIFAPALLSALLSGVLFKPSVWWGFHLSYAVACFVAVAVLWLILKTNGLGLRDIGLKDFKWSHIGWGFLGFIVAFVIWGIVLNILAGFNRSTDWGSEIQFKHFYEVVIIFVYAVIAAPLAEEMLFRGFFITFVGKLCKPWIAAILSCLLFAFYHYLAFGIEGAILILFWVPVPTILFLRKKSLYPGLIMHAFNNLFVYVILALLASCFGAYY
jgi:membrane protease YdiL (CAAX protease family)